MLSKKQVAIAVAAAFATISIPAVAGTAQGPSSSATPYYLNVPGKVDIISILTVGDSVNEKPNGTERYRMVGIPDGLGAYDNHDGTITVLMNHELGATAGTVRQHGATGAFVSQWIIRKSDLKVLHGGDLIKQTVGWDRSSAAFVNAPIAMNRLCSADLAAPTAFYNRRSGKGYTGRIFMNGEESGTEGRAFAHIATGPGAGITYELPSLGRFSWENSVASPFEQDKTVVIGLDDSTPGQVYVYVGDKQSTGSDIEKAGLHGGSLYGVKVDGFAQEDVAASPTRTAGIPSGTRFALHNFGDARTTTGAALQASSVAAGATEFLRPEDGAWDKNDPNVFYFVTTDRYDSIKDGSGGAQVGRSRLYRLKFRDIRDPSMGGTIDQLVDGRGPHQMFDNLTVDGNGDVILQEDPGNQAHNASIWKYNPKSRSLTLLAKSDSARFGSRNGATVTPATPPFTADEESSGVIDVTALLMNSREKGHGHDRDDGERSGDRPHWMKGGMRYYLGVVQAHYPAGDPELVEGGQLFLMSVPDNQR